MSSCVSKLLMHQPPLRGFSSQKGAGRECSKQSFQRQLPARAVARTRACTPHTATSRRSGMAAISQLCLGVPVFKWKGALALPSLSLPRPQDLRLSHSSLKLLRASSHARAGWEPVFVCACARVCVCLEAAAPGVHGGMLVRDVHDAAVQGRPRRVVCLSSMAQSVRERDLRHCHEGKVYAWLSLFQRK